MNIKKSDILGILISTFCIFSYCALATGLWVLNAFLTIQLAIKFHWITR